MYEHFFGLEDEPFRLTPDPRYFFLSPKHAEALAHLRLGLTESSGFVCITGDVGTGKTTLLRAFLAEQKRNVTAAYTVVPPISAFELLRRICLDFGLPASGRSQDELINELHAYLLAQHQAGSISVVIVDEAQALSIELLEQIRLLLNLETETQKLLRIILVGQPQLRKLLLDPALAQLNQRITLRWHLGPLSFRESAGYVEHRLAVASGGRAQQRFFTRPALRLLHSVTGGVPRLINMIAHRALLATFVARETRVSRRFVARAYREIQAVPLPGTLSPARKAAWTAAGLAIGVGLVAFAGPQVDRWLNSRPPAAAPAPVAGGREDGTEAVAVAGAAAQAAPAPPQPQPASTAGLAAPDRPAAIGAPVIVASVDELGRHLASVNMDAGVRTAIDTILAKWGERPLAGGEARLPEGLESIAWRRGLQALSLTANRSMLRLLDLPAVVALRVPGDGKPRYAALIGMDDARMLLAADGAPISVTSDVFERSWSGKAYVLWRDFEGLGTMLRQGGRGIAVVRLQNILHRVDAFADEPTGVFDDATAAAVLEFQRTHLLEQDGLVGPFTDIVLYAAAGNYTRPRLAPAVQAGS